METVQFKLRLDPKLRTALKIRAAQKQIHMNTLATDYLLRGLADDPLEALEEIPKKEAIAQ